MFAELYSGSMFPTPYKLEYVVLRVVLRVQETRPGQWTTVVVFPLG